jgi:hypothetical protein
MAGPVILCLNIGQVGLGLGQIGFGLGRVGARMVIVIMTPLLFAMATPVGVLVVVGMFYVSGLDAWQVGHVVIATLMTVLIALVLVAATILLNL